MMVSISWSMKTDWLSSWILTKSLEKLSHTVPSSDVSHHASYNRSHRPAGYNDVLCHLWVRLRLVPDHRRRAEHQLGSTEHVRESPEETLSGESIFHFSLLSKRENSDVNLLYCSLEAGRSRKRGRKLKRHSSQLKYGLHWLQVPMSSNLTKKKSLSR